VSDFKRLLTSTAGIRWGYRDEPGQGVTFAAQADVTPILEANQAAASHNNGYSPDKSLRRCATIPLIILQKWRETEGWDPFNTSDPDVQKKLAAKLDDPEWQYLRTAEFRVGDHWKHHK
jgi:hypothetical protein